MGEGRQTLDRLIIVDKYPKIQYAIDLKTFYDLYNLLWELNWPLEVQVSTDLFRKVALALPPVGLLSHDRHIESRKTPEGIEYSIQLYDSRIFCRFLCESSPGDRPEFLNLVDWESEGLAPPKESKSATALLVECIDTFSTYEPDSIFVIFTDREGGLTIKGNSTNSQSIGMCEIAKDMLLRRSRG